MKIDRSMAAPEDDQTLHANSYAVSYRLLGDSELAGAVSAVFPASPTGTQSIIPALATEPNGKQANAASQRESFLTKRRIMIVSLGMQRRALPE